ncbi:hypothetical protein [Microbacterium esteraromaticum]|uniref:hypothetical protein n=1 Tax=Microbacterium esteraromaticum TaxID=57043 RepID=UPI00195D226B|nr:hypothetical protein [Microbacterium esteraromaticum]MBM7464580.1 hypothetical protein [Microbacterium esteraromaticum]
MTDVPPIELRRHLHPVELQESAVRADEGVRLGAHANAALRTGRLGRELQLVQANSECRRMRAGHQLIELDTSEEGAERPRIVWSCECGSRGTGATQRAAENGWKRQRAAGRKEYYG